MSKTQAQAQHNTPAKEEGIIASYLESEQDFSKVWDGHVFTRISQQKKREEEAWCEKKGQGSEKCQNRVCDEPMPITMDTCGIWKFFWTTCHEFK
ncbi:hypothetical protein AVEN_37250-1 [Araneus ventricosus]|uniref:Uncharacterized protein n=1 Tax=Araneus ventricosus TaxID=182803 RepID=A0A4Y2P339_ARAVE|nr:hypothetical protein AVEN_37250-1 [Araneus ventricosus]